MDKEVEATLKSLRSRNIIVVYAENSEEALKKILELIPKDAIVGRNDSTSVTQLGIIDALKSRGTKVLERSDLSSNRITTCDIYLTGSNVLTQDGRLVDVDFSGNRIAGIVWGHPKTLIVVGKNKIVKDIDEAFYRLRNVIAPNHIKIRAVDLGGRHRNTPCVATGKCGDCRGNDRMCNVFAIIEGKPSTEITVMIVNEDLGLAWDESWPHERINRIIDNYKKFVWVPPKNPS